MHCSPAQAENTEEERQAGGGTPVAIRQEVKCSTSRQVNKKSSRSWSCPASLSVFCLLFVPALAVALD
eukprot:5900229-Amphidinium_carterae.1